MSPKKMLLLLCVVSEYAFCQPDSIFAVVVGDEATVWHKNAKSNCASKFDFEVTQSQDSITIIERDTVGPLVHCICSFDLTVRFENFAGSFIVMVYRQDLKKYFYQKDTTYFIGLTSFTLPPNQLPYFAISKHQSECGGAPVSVEGSIRTIPKSIRLTVYPNPFNPSTMIRFTLPVSGVTSLKVFDLLGREVATIKNETMNAGEHSVQWDATTIPGGIYLFRLQAGSYTETKKLVLVR